MRTDTSAFKNAGCFGVMDRIWTRRTLMGLINNEPNRLAIDVRRIDHCRGRVWFLDTAARQLQWTSLWPQQFVT
jgi:hypothetical protein